MLASHARPSVPDGPVNTPRRGDQHVRRVARGDSERDRIRDDTHAMLATLDRPRPIEASRIVLVGAGIVNLVTALALIERGARVELVDAGPDPRTDPRWTMLGATHGGDDGRMCSFTEADGFNDRSDTVRSNHDALGSTIEDGGWLTVPVDRLTSRERRWIDDFLSLPHWQAETFRRDIHSFNIAGAAGWAALRRGLPALFENVAHRPGLLRVYTDHPSWAAARATPDDLGSLRRILPAAALRRDHPAWRAAVDSGELVGGIEIEGFTVAIHPLARGILDRLDQRGARLRWQCRIRALERRGETVTGLRSTETTIRGDHYVLSPGATGGALLDGTRCDGKIQGMVGVWARLPQTDPWSCSVKIQREGHVGEHTNAILGQDRTGRPNIVLGAGYGFLGERALELSSQQLVHLEQALDTTARRLLPTAYAEARRDGSFHGERRACVRPCTSTGLGLFEILPASAGGRLLIAGGHNTGGFTQAPAVADAVCATLSGEPHPMQWLYRPDRQHFHAGSSASPVGSTRPAMATR
ncbi:MAG: FAD-dependent oxidoreductase [Acidobacteriota bacterium]